MRFQSTQASCGPASLRNALLALGIERSEEELSQLSGCTATNGTPPKGLIRAITQITGAEPGVIYEAREDVAVLRLVEALRVGRPVILCVDRDEHWVVAFGLLGPDVVHVADSADNELVKHYRPRDLASRWRGVGRRPFYGILV